MLLIAAVPDGINLAMHVKNIGKANNDLSIRNIATSIFMTP